MPASYKYVTFSGREWVLWIELHERSSLLEKAGWQRRGRDWLFIKLSLKRMLEHVAGADEVHHDRCSSSSRACQGKDSEDRQETFPARVKAVDDTHVERPAV